LPKYLLKNVTYNSSDVGALDENGCLPGIQAYLTLFYLLGRDLFGVSTWHPSIASIRSSNFPTVDRSECPDAPCGGNVTARRFAWPGSRA
jgi:hypothetical protein